jgi:hypothetical protein
VGNCIDVVVHCRLDASGHRTVEQIVETAWNSELGEIQFKKVQSDALV